MCSRINLDKSIDEIYTICNEKEPKTICPFFLIVGAGVSTPEIPLASVIIDECKKINESRKKEDDGFKTTFSSPSEEYSYWLEKAFPARELRRQYFEKIIENSNIAYSNFEIANILSSKKFFNLVVTTNFDNQIEKSLIFQNNFSYYISKNEIDNLAVNLLNDDVQIIQVHGDFKAYSFKNTLDEISKNTNKNHFLSMVNILKDILKDRSPIIIGYSGWENDPIMTAFKERLEYPAPYPYYWYCYSKQDYENLPNWIKDRSDVKFIYKEYDENEVLSPDFDNSKLLNITKLPAKEILNKIIKKFDIKEPEIYNDPLLLFENLKKHLSFNEAINPFEETNKFLTKYQEIKEISNKQCFDYVENNINSLEISSVNSSLLESLIKNGPIIIPEFIDGKKVTSIGKYAFKSLNSNIKAVVIPNSIKIIDCYAFSDCSFESIVLPQSVELIKDYAFYNCKSLKSIEIPSTCTSIGSHAFDGCSALENINILSTIGGYSLSNCESLKSVYIGENVNKISPRLFKNCPSLESIIVDKNNKYYDSRNDANAIIETKSNRLIAGCKKTIIPEGITSIGDYAFCGIESLKEIDIPSSVSHIGNYAFLNCTSLKEIKNGEEVLIIGECAFSGCRALKVINYFNKIRQIGSCAFLGCTSIKSITIPNSIESVGMFAFANCSSLIVANLPYRTISIRDHVFDGCSQLIVSDNVYKEAL